MTVQRKQRKAPLKPLRQSGDALLRRVIARYGWTPFRVERVRGAWRVETEEGIFALKKASCSAKKLAFVHQAMEEARAQGVESILPWVPSRKGRPLIEESGGAWYATRWYGGDLNLREASSEALIRELAVLHRAMETTAEQGGGFRYRAGKELIARWNGTRNQIREFGNTLRSRGFRSPFEQMLNDQGDLLDKAISFAVRGMERYVESEKGIPPHSTLCHNRIHPSNILQGSGGWKWIDWDHARVDSPARDLALFFRQLVDVSEGGGRILSLLDAYEQERKLSRKEKKLLALYLAYPDAISRLLRQYRNAGGTLTEAGAVRRLRLELDRLRGVQEAVGELWPRRPDSRGKSRGYSRKGNVTVAAAQPQTGGGGGAPSSG
jgi:spore coat protein YsxE